MIEIIIEVGPASVRRLHPAPVCVAEPGLVRKALGGLDDPIVLVDDRPTEVDSLWRLIVESLVDRDCGLLTLVFPTGWPSRYTDRVIGVVNSIADKVVALSRAGLCVENTGHIADSGANVAAEVIVEFSCSHVTICQSSDVVDVLPRPLHSDVVLAHAAVDGAGKVHIDVPEGVDAAQEVLALQKSCAGAGRAIFRVDINQAVRQRIQAIGSPRPRNRMRLSRRSLVAVCVCVGVSVMVAVAGGYRQAESLSADEGAELVEGRVAVRFPADWSIERVTAGPGSKRVRASPAIDEINSPAQLALHLTQAYAPSQTFADVAAGVETMVKSQQSESFTEFNPNDVSLGRLTVSYRELRGVRVVHWHVFMAGSIRIGIGCQSATGRELDIANPCGVAVRSARELRGVA